MSARPRIDRFGKGVDGQREGIAGIGDGAACAEFVERRGGGAKEVEQCDEQPVAEHRAAADRFALAGDCGFDPGLDPFECGVGGSVGRFAGGHCSHSIKVREFI
jgi:hypothetical protein